ncbi:NAD(P)/FAD-dependent oxidoreductase [Plastoroseomonas hellenica]|uniref:NAD(P)/FAD-dependent oxidoreductase n=1 Tax=Plastoroseomonas hellenica TaxID=2687306 RepID=UPI001BA8540A|nr:NAD(P)/FAD-dependent oxidoreductase [Plastoroseomonas hellenica]MBR0641444.1 NAD(P)/FAD-dependent oxidoreductase [Plastoroseomonas hellenica]
MERGEAGGLGADRNGTLHCLIVGGGPAGLTAALYLARFQRRFLLADSGHPRAASIPVSHNIPFFPEGISGLRVLELQQAHLRRYRSRPVTATVTRLERREDAFHATLEDPDGGRRTVQARRVILATGAVDVEPDLPDLPDAVRRGLVRYCPICDGFEARGRRIAVIGHGDQGLGEAVFIARTYSNDVSLLTLGTAMALTAEQRSQAARHGITVLEAPVRRLLMEDGRILALHTGEGVEHRFDLLYSALGLTLPNTLARSLGARCNDAGALFVDDHNQTSVPGLYAAGAIVHGLDQVVIAMGHAAVAATHVHNRCDLPFVDER